MKTLSGVLFVLFSCFLFAQSPVDQGVWNIGGSVSYTNSSTGDYDVEQFSFNPNAGYFIIDNLSAGIVIDYIYQKYENTELNRLQIGPAVRYYFTKSNVIPFIGASYRYSAWDLGSSSDLSSNTIEFSAGADYFVAKNVAIEASINYAIENISLPDNFYYPQEQTNKTFSLAIGLNFFLY